MGSTKWLPCVPDLAPYLNQEVLEILKVRGKPLPFLYGALGQACKHLDCKHHVFHPSQAVRKFKISEKRPLTENAWTKHMCNCLCLMERAATMQEFTEAHGISATRLKEIEGAALEKFKKSWMEIVGESYFQRKEGQEQTPKKRGRSWVHYQ